VRARSGLLARQRRASMVSITSSPSRSRSFPRLTGTQSSPWTRAPGRPKGLRTWDKIAQLSRGRRCESQGRVVSPMLPLRARGSIATARLLSKGERTYGSHREIGAIDPLRTWLPIDSRPPVSTMLQSSIGAA
jgi:hypothetical protein